LTPARTAGFSSLTLLIQIGKPKWTASHARYSLPIFLGKAVQVVAGRHIVELYYAAGAFYVGRAISLGSIALLFALYLICRRRAASQG
jgi:hypothetical protein